MFFQLTPSCLRGNKLLIKVVVFSRIIAVSRQPCSAFPSPSNVFLSTRIIVRACENCLEPIRGVSQLFSAILLAFVFTPSQHGFQLVSTPSFQSRDCYTGDACWQVDRKNESRKFYRRIVFFQGIAMGYACEALNIPTCISIQTILFYAIKRSVFNNFSK